MIDWDLAVSAGLAARRRRPGRDRDGGRRGRGRAARRRRPVDRAGPRLHRPGRRRAHRAGARRRPRRLGAGQRRRVRRRCIAPVVEKLADKKGAPVAGRARPSAPGSPAPRSVCCSASWPARCSASSTRSHEPAGPAAARRAQHRPRRARARGRPHRLPALGLPARGDPPGAVHRRPVDARPPRSARWTRSSDTVEPTRLARRRRSSGSPRRVRGDGGSLLDVLGTPEQKEVIDRITGVMSLLEGHADVVMDGVGPEVIPSVADIRAQVQPAPQGRRLPRPACCAGCSASTPRWRSTATAPRSSAASSTRSAWTASTPSGPSPRTCPSKAEIADPAAWVRPRPRLSPCGARPGRRRGPARRTPRRSPTSSRARRCSSPAPAAPTRWRCWPPPSSRPARTPGGWSASTVDHGLQDGLGGAGRAASSAQMAATRRRRDASASGSASRAPGSARRRRPGRRGTPRWPRSPHGLGAPSCCSATPSTTRPRRCCWGWPAGRGGRSLAGMRRGVRAATGARCSTSPARRPSRRLRGRGHRVLGATRTTTTRAFTRSRVRHAVLPVLEDELGPGVRGRPGPDRRPAPRRRGRARRPGRRRRSASATATTAGLARRAGRRSPRPSAAGCSGWPPLDAGAPAAELFHEHVARRGRAGHRLARASAGSSCPATSRSCVEAGRLGFERA